ncbi:hypothetical protein EDB89DRAFT_1914699 [Lactarius sanguifluus]|nr:hypothetical protein EDB89DRAFT_1914699 [Lactarius sanguifluus]
MAALGSPVPEILDKSVRTAALQLRGSEDGGRKRRPPFGQVVISSAAAAVQPSAKTRKVFTRQHGASFAEAMIALSLLPSVPYSFGTQRTPRSNFTHLKMALYGEEDAAGGQERAPQSGATADNNDSASKNGCSITSRNDYRTQTTGDDLRRSDMAGDVRANAVLYHWTLGTCSVITFSERWRRLWIKACAGAYESRLLGL